MKKSKKKISLNKGIKYKKPVSLYPLTPDQALKIFLRAEPKDKKGV
jgi:hypothetical protein